MKNENSSIKYVIYARKSSEDKSKQVQSIDSQIEVMKEYWTKIKGHARKAMFTLTAVLALQAVAISNLIEWGYPSIRISDVRA